MNVLVINGSPSGENSITLCTVKYLQVLFPDVQFHTLQAGQQIHRLENSFDEVIPQLEEADLLLFCYPVYTFLVPYQLHRFLELIREHGVNLTGKFATQISTSKHFYDVTAHQFIEDNCHDLGLRPIHGLSADMEDLLTDKGRMEAQTFFAHVLWCMKAGISEPAPRRAAMLPRSVPDMDCQLPAVTKKAGRVVIVTDSPSEHLSALISVFSARLPCASEVVDLKDFPFAGGCLGCFHCARDGKCVYKDGFDAFLREKIQTADATVYAFQIKGHSMGSRFKLYDDRQFCNGHRTVTMGKPVAYLVDGDLEAEPNLRMVMEARAQVGGNFLAGIAEDTARCLDVAISLDYAISNSLQAPKNFYGVGGMKIFRDLIYLMQGLMREDHRFYKAHGFYDFPQKHRGRVLGMYFVSFLMNFGPIKKKARASMTKGMLMPYNKVLEKARKENDLDSNPEKAVGTAPEKAAEKTAGSTEALPQSETKEEKEHDTQL